MTNLAKYGIDLSVAKAYAENLELHLECVRVAGQALGVSLKQLRAHDSSKWGYDEFPHYATFFYGSPAKANPTEFQRAVLHHFHHNKHHWQTWLSPDGFCFPGADCENGALEMPENYVLEMVADWQGAGMAYSGSADMTDWLKANLPKIKLHSKSRIKLYEVLTTLGYGSLKAPLDGIEQ